MKIKKDINIDLSKDCRHGVIQILNRRLCDEYFLDLNISESTA